VEDDASLVQGFFGPEWNPEMSLEMMGRNNIGTALLSCAIPNTVFGKDAVEIAALSREINDYLASLRDQYPSRFGFFATLPSLEDVPRCIDEIRYAFSVLKADGVGLFTSYSDKYLGRARPPRCRRLHSPNHGRHEEVDQRTLPHSTCLAGLVT
jgi:predicted TIM-barrel fold metal-dependent hydrolase